MSWDLTIWPVDAVRGITAPCSCCDAQVISFDLPGSAVVRLKLTKEHRVQLAAYLGAEFPAQGVTCQACAQSSKASGNPQSAGSTPDDGQNTAPAHRSSSAAMGE